VLAFSKFNEKFSIKHDFSHVNPNCLTELVLQHEKNQPKIHGKKNRRTFMKKQAAGSVLFGAILLTAFFSFNSTQTVSGTTELQQERQTKRTEGGRDQTESIAEILKQTLIPDESGVLGVSFKATAYCLRGRTASGKMVRKGIIAADPRILPLGTNVTILQGPYAGDYLVADTGGKIKGNRIDIWMASCSEAIRFGNRPVMLRVPERADG